MGDQATPENVRALVSFAFDFLHFLFRKVIELLGLMMMMMTLLGFYDVLLFLRNRQTFERCLLSPSLEDHRAVGGRQ
jgi:hypothetical protein